MGIVAIRLAARNTKTRPPADLADQNNLVMRFGINLEMMATTTQNPSKTQTNQSGPGDHPSIVKKRPKKPPWLTDLLKSQDG
jgi:hypothetical protein